MMLARALAIIGALAALAACATESASRYACAGLEDFVAVYEEDEVRVIRRNQPDLVLPQVSETTWRDGQTIWSLQGTRAIFTIDGSTYTCRPY